MLLSTGSNLLGLIGIGGEAGQGISFEKNKVSAARPV